ncbi:MAG: hypothetical protein JWN36_1016 [Microbacteriaceae bacterium]|nr:hypothetical protein [Microbacteriaceae bacterium]
MNRSLTALFSALEALLVVAVGVGIPLAPLTVLWAFQYGLAIDWVVFWRASVDTWLIGHGVDVTFTLQPELATGLGFPAAGTPFIVTIAALGFALLTILMGARAGRRIGETRHRVLGGLVAIGVFAALSLGVTLGALWPSARASIWQGTLLPTLCFGIGLVIGAELGRRSLGPAAEDAPRGSLRDWIADRPVHVRATVAAGLRAGAASVAAVLAVSGVLVAILLVSNYAKIISLYEGVHSEVFGGIALTVGQAAFLPNLVIWAASWLVGPGFAVGTGSSVSAFGTSLGPVPAIPILGALPSSHELSWGFLGLLVPLVAAFLVAVLVRRRLVRQLDGVSRVGWLVLAGLIAGVVGGVLMGLLAWASAGAAGPGRLADVGPAPFLVGGVAALEFAVASVVGLLAGRTTLAAERPR